MNVPMKAEMAGSELVAITGATGFVGAAVLRSLNCSGVQTRCLRRPRKLRTDPGHALNAWVDGDLQNIQAIEDLVDGATTIIHIAGATTAPTRSDFLEINMIGAFTLAALSRQAGVKRFVLISSQTARAPDISAYAASKRGGEAAVHLFDKDMQVTIIRPPAVIGPGDPMLAPVFKWMQRGWLPAPAETAGTTREFAAIAVDDLVRVITKVATRSGSEPRLIEPCSITSANWVMVADAASEITQRRIRLLRIPTFAMRSVGRIADLLQGVFRIALPITSGKVRELLTLDWSLVSLVDKPTALSHMIGASLDPEHNLSLKAAEPDQKNERR